ncbi:PAS domain S-box protein [Horticoccus luteus]|uniref:histidine kinase n=1 Tax=Horticoccus luteus TaxID=2862869 RepID=A0A8F9TVY5_9BACT|nr:PAS domain-containing sensor histidine kinase [Horticoccus luteus]QYM78769.1 PAS domain S-box protein [Horticoccus luteus]
MQPLASESTPPRPAAHWLKSKGALGREIEALDWAKTAFGPLATWPEALRFAVNFTMGAGAATAVIWGPEYRMLYNDRYREILGAKHPRSLGSRAPEIFPEVWEELRPLFEQAYRGEAVLIEDMALMLDRGGVSAPAYFSGSYSPIYHDNGEVAGFIATVVETTKRIALEKARAQEFDTILSAIADFAYSFDREGRFVYMNKALLDLWGLPREEAVGKNFYELKHPDELAARLHKQIETVFVTKTQVRDETPFLSPTGVEGYYEYIFSPVFGADGSVMSVAGSTREISARKRMERELQDVQTRMEAALSAGAIGTWSFDVKKNVVVADRILARFFGISEEEARGGPMERYVSAIHPEDRERVSARIAQALEDGQNYEVEYRVVGTDGRLRWLVARGSVQRDGNGEAVSLPGMALDVTERKKLENQIRATITDLEAAKAELERQAAALEETVAERTARLRETVTELEAFSYSISHDLRGPLRVMQSFAQALREDCGAELSDVGQDYIRRIVAAAARMDRVIQDVLVFSRIARTDLALEPIALEEFVPSLLEGYPAFHEAKADIAIEGHLPTVMANAAALTQCLSNLIGNATKFVAPGVRPQVVISGRVENGRAFVAVRDNGIGIPASGHESIFGVFSRLASGYEGTGIGLAIVRKAVERMGGAIHVESEVGRGSTFTFELAAATPA